MWCMFVPKLGHNAFCFSNSEKVFFLLKQDPQARCEATPHPPKNLRSRPHSHISGDFVSANLFMQIHLAFHTCPLYTLGVSRDFCIRSPEGKFLYTLCIRICVDACIWIFLYTLTSQNQNQSFPGETLLTYPLRYPGTMVYMWTVVFDLYTLLVDADIFVSA